MWPRKSPGCVQQDRWRRAPLDETGKGWKAGGRASCGVPGLEQSEQILQSRDMCVLFCYSDRNIMGFACLS